MKKNEQDFYDRLGRALSAAWSLDRRRDRDLGNGLAPERPAPNPLTRTLPTWLVQLAAGVIVGGTGVLMFLLGKGAC